MTVSMRLYEISRREMTRAFRRLIKNRTPASDAYDIAMSAAADAGYSM